MESPQEPPAPPSPPQGMPTSIREAAGSLGEALVRVSGSKKESVWKLPSGWVWGFAPIVFAALRVLVVSHGDPETLRALVQNLNVPALVLATVLPFGAVISVGFVIFLACRLRSSNKPPINGGPLLLLISAVISVFLLVYAMPMWHVCAAATICGIIGVIMLIGKVINCRAQKGDENGTPNVLVMLLVVVAILGVLFSPIIYLLGGVGMWLPQERIEAANTEVSPVYVLSSDDNWTSYMDENRKVHLVTTSDITSRDAVGSSGSWLDKSFADNVIDAFIATVRWAKSACLSAVDFIVERLPDWPSPDSP
ncbi:hypothetical protein NM962_20580 [Mycobacterium sp. SVM_VP21]|nr:hypothetical protein NM962_20580 [Mycobacterium sp. SVM_VP21]